jgi:hypothetical protein
MNSLETKPKNWEEWRKSDYRILTPEAYELYKTYRKQIIRDQASLLEKDTKGKTNTWLNTLKTWMKGGFQEKKFNVYAFQQGGASSSQRTEIQNRRNIWKKDRKEWQNHWTRLAQDLSILPENGKQYGGALPVSKEWGRFQNEEAQADCTYRWNDKIRHLVDDFLTHEAQTFDEYLRGRTRPGFEAWRWEMPWIQRRMKTLSDTIRDWSQMRQQNINPHWIPPEEKLPGAPNNWDLTIQRIKNTNININTEDARYLVKTLDLDFWRKSKTLWNILPNQAWQLQVWWLLFGPGETENDKQLEEILGDDTNKRIRNTRINQREFEISEENGNQGEVVRPLRHAIVLSEEGASLQELNHQRDWVNQMAKLMEILADPASDWNDQHIHWNEELQTALRRWAILSWLGWNHWDAQQTNQHQFIQQMDQWTQNQELYQQAWEQTKNAFV